MFKPMGLSPRIEGLSTVEGEEKVLDIFRTYGVIPYQMLCLDRQVQAVLAAPIKRLIRKGLIVCEGRHEAYHLTPSGYEVLHGRAELG